MPRAFPFTTRDGRQGVVRPARPRDARAVLAIVREILHERPRTIGVSEADFWSPRDWRRHRMDWGPAGVTLVAEVEGRLAGSLDATRGKRDTMRHVAQFGVSVAAEYRGAGVGWALLTMLERWAREHGIDRIELGVFPENDRARALYQRLGYEVEGRQRRAVRFPEGDVDIVIMSKLLTGTMGPSEGG